MQRQFYIYIYTHTRNRNSDKNIGHCRHPRKLSCAPPWSHDSKHSSHFCSLNIDFLLFNFHIIGVLWCIWQLSLSFMHSIITGYWVVSSFLLFWNKILGPLLYVSFGEYSIWSFLLGIFPEFELPGYRVSITFFSRHFKLLPSACTKLHSNQQQMKWLVSPFNFSHTSVQWQLIVYLIVIS